MLKKLLFAAVAAIALFGPVAADVSAAAAQGRQWIPPGGQGSGGPAMRGSGRMSGQPAAPMMRHQFRGNSGPMVRPGAGVRPQYYSGGYRHSYPGNWNHRRHYRGGYYGGGYYGGYYGPGLMFPFMVPSYGYADCYYVRRYGTWYDRAGYRHRGWHRVRVCD